jgi:hypothetical protein
MEFVSWDDDYSQYMESHKIPWFHYWLLYPIISHYIPLKTPLYPIKKPCSKPPTRILIPINIHQISGDMDGRFNPYHQIIIPKREEFPTNKKRMVCYWVHFTSHRWWYFYDPMILLLIFLWSNFWKTPITNWGTSCSNNLPCSVARNLPILSPTSEKLPWFSNRWVSCEWLVKNGITHSLSFMDCDIPKYIGEYILNIKYYILNIKLNIVY